MGVRKYELREGDPLPDGILAIRGVVYPAVKRNDVVYRQIPNGDGTYEYRFEKVTHDLQTVVDATLDDVIAALADAIPEEKRAFFADLEPDGSGGWLLQGKPVGTVTTTIAVLWPTASDLGTIPAGTSHDDIKAIIVDATRAEVSDGSSPLIEVQLTVDGGDPVDIDDVLVDATITVSASGGATKSTKILLGITIAETVIDYNFGITNASFDENSPEDTEIGTLFSDENFIWQVLDSTGRVKVTDDGVVSVGPVPTEFSFTPTFEATFRGTSPTGVIVDYTVIFDVLEDLFVIPTVESLNVTVARNVEAPGRIDVGHTVGAAGEGYTVDLYIGSDPDGNTAFLTNITNIALFTSSDKFSGVNRVVVYIRDATKAVIDKKLVATLAEVGSIPTISYSDPTTAGINNLIAGTTVGQAVVAWTGDPVITLNNGATDLVTSQVGIVNGVDSADTVVLAANDSFEVRVDMSATGAADQSVTSPAVTVRAAATTAPGTLNNVVNYDGAVLQLSTSKMVGTFADGSYWINGGGDPVTIPSVAPASALSVRSISGGGSTDSSRMHGLMIDPGKAPSGTTLAARQAVNDGSTNGVGGQGYDSWEGTGDYPDSAYDYSSVVNRDPGATGTALTIATEATLVKAVSTTGNVNSQARPVIQKLVPFTILKAFPNIGDFRPGPSDPVKTPWLNVNDVDFSKLPNLATGTLTIPAYAATLAALRFQSWQHTYNANSRNIVPEADGAPVYGGKRYVWTEAMLGLCYDTWTTAQKRAIVIRLIQLAIDITARAEQGAVWQDNGGHCVAQKSLVAFAAFMTGHQRFKDALEFTTTFAVFGGGVASIWGEDRQMFRVSQEDLDRNKAYPYRSSQLGVAEWSGDATRKDPNDYKQRQNSLGVYTPQKDAKLGETVDYSQDYRHIIARVSVPAALALRLMGAAGFMKTLWLDYQDRHMAARIAAGTYLPNGKGNDITPWVLSAWSRDRTKAGTGTGTGGVTSPPVVTNPTPANRIFADDKNTRILFEQGQSNPYIAFTHQSYYNPAGPARPTILTANIRFIAIDHFVHNPRGIIDRLVDNDNVQARRVNNSLAAASVALDRVAPGKNLIFALGARSGTSRAFEMADSDTRRNWDDRLFVDQYLRDNYGEVDLVTEYWEADDTKTFEYFDTEWSAAYRGRYMNGDPHELNTINLEARTWTTRPFEHHFWDDKVSGVGDGLYSKTTFWTHTEEDRHNKKRRAAFARLRSSTGMSSRVFPVMSPIDAHMFEGGHAVTDDPDGQVYFMWSYFKTFVELLLNKVIPEPYLKRFEEGPNGEYIDYIIGLPNGGDLGTHRSIAGRSAATSPLPNQTDVFGAVVKRGTGPWHAVIRPGTSGYPTNVQGTVRVVHSGSGTGADREGRIRFTPVVPFGPGDETNFRVYRDEATLAGASMTDAAKPWLNHPAERVPGWTDLTAVHPHPGLPMQRSQTVPYALTGSASTGGGTTGGTGGETGGETGGGAGGVTNPDKFFALTGGGPRFNDPSNPGSGVFKMGWKLRAFIPSGAPTISGGKLIYSQISTGCEWRYSRNGGESNLYLSTVEDSGGISQSKSTNLTTVLPEDQWIEIEAYVDLSNNTTGVRLNGGAWTTGSITSSNTGTFQSSRAVGLFARSDGVDALHETIRIEYAEIYFNNNLRKRVAGTAAEVNADPWKQGADAVQPA